MFLTIPFMNSEYWFKQGGNSISGSGSAARSFVLCGMDSILERGFYTKDLIFINYPIFAIY